MTVKRQPSGKAGKERGSQKNDFPHLPEAIISNVGIGIYIVQDRIFTYASPFYQELVGYSATELIGENSLDHVHPDDKTTVRENAFKALKGEIPKPYEYRFIRKDGKTIWVLEMVTSVIHKGRRASLGSFIDITERKEMEEMLKQSMERFRNLVETTCDMIWEIDKDGVYTFINLKIKDLLGYDPREVIGKKTPFDMMLPEERMRLEEAFIAIVKDRKAFANLENWNLHKNGRRVLLETGGVPFFDAEGQYAGYRGIDRDITERKRTEERLNKEVELKNFLLELYKKAPALADKELYDHVLDQVVRVSESTIGFFHLVSDDQKSIYLTTWNSEALKNCTALYATHYPIDQAGNWVDCARFKKPIVYNDFPQSPNQKGLPDGHTPVQRFMSVPVVEGDKVLIIFGVGNKIEEYNEHDVLLVQLLANDLQKIIGRRRAEEELQESETKFRNLFESASDAIFLMDQNVFIDCNQKALEMFGCTKEQIIGQTPYRVSPEVQPDGRNSLEKAQEKINAAMSGQPQFFEWKHCRYDGTLFDVEVSLNIVRSAGKNYLQTTVHDITERKRAEDRIKYLATHDTLTDLPNRLMFNQLLNHAIQTAQRYKRQLAVIFFDLDRFKVINDTLGHEAGDKLLQEMATRLRQALRAVDVIARLGGDEFVILIEEIKGLEQVATVARNVLSTVIKPMTIMGQECRVTASIGISIYPKDGMDEQTLMKTADIAMYFAKEEGKNNYQFYSNDIKSQSIERLSIETNLREALERNELSLHYQAKLDFKTGAITGVEALLRWQNPSLGSVPPLQLIPVAEETGLIVPIGRWVLKTACIQNVAWQNQGLPPVCMAVNLSLRQLTDAGLIEDIRTALEEPGMAPNLLELEITESMVMHDPKRMIKVLSKIKDLGVRLAIDDFGTGYSSLSQLKHFPIDTLKVDRSFIRNIPENTEDKAITEAIIAMGKTLRLTVVAEGVETQEQMDFLQEHSCDEMQGFYFSKPVEPEQFADLLRTHVPIGQK